MWGWEDEEKKRREERRERRLKWRRGRRLEMMGEKKNERDSSQEYCNEFSLKAMKREQEKV